MIEIEVSKCASNLVLFLNILNKQECKWLKSEIATLLFEKILLKNEIKTSEPR